MPDPTFLTLGEWGGHSAGRALLALPVPKIWVHHSVTNESGDPTADFRTLDLIGLSNGHGGISYSYAIHPSGVIGEGQGLRIGAHTAVPGHNENPISFGICFIGNYNDDTLTPEAIDAFHWLRDVHLAGKVAADPPTDGHRNAPGQSTACPGNNNMAALPILRAPYTPTPPPPPEQKDTLDMELIVHNLDDGRWWYFPPFCHVPEWIEPAWKDKYAAAGIPVGEGDTLLLEGMKARRAEFRAAFIAELAAT
jgi:hypothetical protein